MKLLDLIKQDHKLISIVGMAKNAGKTEVLNEIIDQTIIEDKMIGITSIGRDGESEDIVTSTDKPLIYVSAGTLIATLEGFIVKSEIEVEILEVTEYSSSMGRIIIGRAVQDGCIQIAGPSSNKGIRKVSEKMLSLGAEFVLVDGALSRVSSASPAITDATILSTGAVLSRDIKKVVRKTIHQVHLFSLDEIQDNEVSKLSKEAIDKNEVTLIDDENNCKKLTIKTAINAGKEISGNIKDNTKYIVFPGSLVSGVIKDIYESGKYKEKTFIVEDATKIFVSERDLRFYIKMGINIQVLNKINLLAITINPYSHTGYSFSSKEFKNELKKYINDIPIIDVLESR